MLGMFKKGHEALSIYICDLFMHWPHEFIQNKIRYAHTDLIRIIQETVFSCARGVILAMQFFCIPVISYHRVKGVSLGMCVCFESMHVWLNL